MSIIKKFLGIQSPSGTPEQRAAASKALNEGLAEGMRQAEADDNAPVQPKQSKQDAERRKVQRMNARNQVNDSHARLKSAIADFTQTYLDTAGGLELEESQTVAQALTDLGSNADMAIEHIEEQFNQDLMKEQREQQ